MKVIVEIGCLIITIFIFPISCSKNDSDSSEKNSGTTTQSGATTNNNLPVETDTLFGDGVNLQPSYYNNGNVNFGWDLMKQQTKIKIVRVEIEPGFVTQAKSWIAQAVSNGYKIIATYHKASVLGSDDTAELMIAARWWQTNYATLAASGSFAINLMNEWGSHNISPAAYATAYNNALAIVRTVYKGRVIIDIPGWGQETYTAYQACKTSNPAISDTNIILSTHIYPGNWNQGKNHTFQQSDLDDMSNTGRPCIVGEFGTGTGSCDWSGCVDYAKSKKWAVLAWSWNGDGNNLNMVSPSWAQNGSATTFTLSNYFDTVYARL
ncbi:MAG: hypothetical protein PW786_03000 [Arachidicoccus sp.]|nr:hypothetical protein [Arachidicoccus sp.]